MAPSSASLVGAHPVWPRGLAWSLPRFTEGCGPPRPRVFPLACGPSVRLLLFCADACDQQSGRISTGLDLCLDRHAAPRSPRCPRP